MILRTALALGLLALAITLFNPFAGPDSYVYAAPNEPALTVRRNDPGRCFPNSWVHKVNVLESTHYRLYTTLLSSEEVSPIKLWEGIFQRVYQTNIEGVESAWRSARR